MWQTAAGANDILVIGRSDLTKREKFLKKKRETDETGVLVNEEKTKYHKLAKGVIKCSHTEIKI